MNGYVYAEAETLLDIQHVTLEFGDRLILRDVNATIHNIVRPDVTQGQVIGILGPSGVGKSQLARIIAGLQLPTGGTVLVEGQPSAKGRVGMVAQNYILFDWATVLGNLTIAGKQAGLTVNQAFEKTQYFIDLFDLSKHRNQYPPQLSGGTRQRVAISQQLMGSGHFLIMDEPFSGLDLIMKRRTCELIATVANIDEKNSIFVVTHDVTEAASISDHLWLMGYDRNAANVPIEGARIVETYDLAKMGLAWHPNLVKEPEFQDFVNLVKERFATLKEF